MPCRDHGSLEYGEGAIEREDEAPHLLPSCHPEIRTQREQASESMCERAMGEVRWANAVHQKLNHWTQAFLA